MDSNRYRKFSPWIQIDIKVFGSLGIIIIPLDSCYLGVLNVDYLQNSFHNPSVKLRDESNEPN